MNRNEDTNYWIEAARSRLSRRRALALGAGGIAGAAMLGCATQNKGGGQAAPAAGGQANVAPNQGTPQSGGTYTYYTQLNPRLDPQKESAGNQVAVSGVYSRLFR